MKSIFLTIFKDSSIASCLDSFSFLFSLEEWLAQRPSTSLTLNYETVVINSTAKEASLSVTARGSAWTTNFTWFRAAAPTTDIKMTASSSTDHTYPHGLWRQH